MCLCNIIVFITITQVLLVIYGYVVGIELYSNFGTISFGFLMSRINRSDVLWQLKNLLVPVGLRVMLLLCLQICLWACVTLNFDLMTARVDSLVPFPRGSFVPKLAS